MNLAVSNIAWDINTDNEMYTFLKENGFDGLEIAPTRIFPDSPYDNISGAEKFARLLHDENGLKIVSMQSILFGRTENIFGTEEEYSILVNYMKKAIDFAAALKCENLVFGCPKNRQMGDKSRYGIAVKFFSEIGEYAKSKGTTVSIEANPSIYGTDFVNTTEQAVQLIKDVSPSILGLNLDFGTIIQNGEDVGALNLEFVNHVHISEPQLAPITRRAEHEILLRRLSENGYKKYISIEMKNSGNLNNIKEAISYIRRLAQTKEVD